MAGDGRRLRLATRGSPLALAQTRIVAAAIEAACGVGTETVVVETLGDRRQSEAIHRLGGQGVFAKEVDQAVLDHRADAAVHSAKDLPAGDGDGRLRILAVPERADSRDALVGARLDELAPGARVATGSVRRRAQLAFLRPDLTFEELRGNIARRLAKVPPRGAAVVAACALERLERLGEAAEIFSTRAMLPQAGQGTIAVVGWTDDGEVCSVLAMVDDAAARACLEAERSYLATLGGGCDLPVGAHAVVEADGSIRLEAMVASYDGHELVREELTSTEPAALGQDLAARMMTGWGAALLGTR